MRKRSSKAVHSESDRRDNETEKLQLKRRRRRPDEMTEPRRYVEEGGERRKLQDLMAVRDGGKRKTETTFSFSLSFYSCKGKISFLLDISS